MIVIVGHPRVVLDEVAVRPAGTVAVAALVAARRGATVQLLGKVGDDDAGDALLVALARAGVGHAAVLRDPARPTPQVASPPETDGLDVAAEPEPESPDPARGDRSSKGIPSPALDPADVDLGLRYLADFRVLVAAEPLPVPILGVVVDAARYAGAQLVLVTAQGHPAPALADLPAGAIVLEGPHDDAEGTFGTLLGEVTASIDAGTTPADAVKAAVAAVGAVRPEG